MWKKSWSIKWWSITNTRTKPVTRISLTSLIELRWWTLPFCTKDYRLTWGKSLFLNYRKWARETKRYKGCSRWCRGCQMIASRKWLCWWENCKEEATTKWWAEWVQRCQKWWCNKVYIQLLIARRNRLHRHIRVLGLLNLKLRHIQQWTLIKLPLKLMDKGATPQWAVDIQICQPIMPIQRPKMLTHLIILTHPIMLCPTQPNSTPNSLSRCPALLPSSKLSAPWKSSTISFELPNSTLPLR